MDISVHHRPPEFIGKLWLPDDIINKRLIDTDRWQLTQSFRIGLPDGRLIVIPAGFIYDKGSVPRLVQWYLRRDEANAEKGFLTHDFLYLIQAITGQQIPRIVADRLFNDINKNQGLRWDRRIVAYRGVRVGGWAAWNKRAKKGFLTHN